MGVWLRKLEFLSFEDFAAAKFRGGCEMELMCQEGVSQRGCMGLRNHFAAKRLFRSGDLISQPMAIFAGAPFGL